MKIHSQKSDANTNNSETISISVIYTSTPCNRNTGKGRDNFGVLLGRDVTMGKGPRKREQVCSGRTPCVNTAMSV